MGAKRKPAPPATKWTEPSLCRSYGPAHDLKGNFGVVYYSVEALIVVWVKTGKTRASNVWYGASNVLSQELEEVRLIPGDLLLVTPGNALWALRASDRKARPVYLGEGRYELESRTRRIDPTPELVRSITYDTRAS